MHKGRNIFSMLAATLLIALVGAMATGCDAIYDDLEPCPQGARLRFVYDYNMEFANAFPSQVDCVTLLVYDTDGRYLTSVTETSEVLKDENWRMDLPLEPGTYRFVAWGGMSCDQASFRFNANPSALPMGGVQVSVIPDQLTSPRGTRFHSLFYGALTMTIPAQSTDYVEGTVEMMKDTNNIRILLQNLSGAPLTGDDFIFNITDDNTVLAYDNDVIPGNTYTYWPWASGQAEAGLLDNGEKALLAYAEFSTSRLVYGNPCHLVIKRPGEDQPTFDVPLIEFLLMLKSQEFDWMGEQEFLDRESRWNMILFMDQRGNWMKTYIKINDWIVRINNTHF